MKSFPHYCGTFQDERIQLIYREFGYEGLGLLYAILERLADKEKPLKTDVLKLHLRIKKRLEKCWEFMESIGILTTENNNTHSDLINTEISKYSKTKQLVSNRVAKCRENKALKNDVTRYQRVTNALHTENSEENPKPKRAAKVSFDASEIELPFNGKFAETWREWCASRKDKRKPISERAAKQQIELLSCYTEPIAIQMLLASITNDWQGIFPLKNNLPFFENGSKQSNSTGGLADGQFSERFQTVAERIAARHAGK